MMKKRCDIDCILKEGVSPYPKTMTPQESMDYAMRIFDEGADKIDAMYDKEEPNKVVVENGKVKTIFNESTKAKGWLELEEAKRLTLESVKKIYELNNTL